MEKRQEKAKEKEKEANSKPQRTKNNDKAIARTERDIQRLEEKIAGLDQLAEENGSDYQKLMEIAAEKETLETELMELYEKWEELNQ